MARKKFYAQQDELKQSVYQNRWKVAKYIRLSRMDGDNLESDSIINQRKLLNDYIEEHEEFLYSEEFCDEDWTGTNFNRPAFQRMMKEIKSGKINCLILKDLSRFGRNYIEAGRYLEEVLPKYNCRVISVIDDLDSYKNAESVTGLMVRIKNLIHDHNSQDISKKVRETKNMLRKQGKNISQPPFGYIKDPSDRYKMIIDEEAATVVQMIFSMYLEGMGTIRIAQKLNTLGIVTRADYMKTGSIYKEENATYSKSGWRPNSVRSMLSNKAYIGAVDQRRKTTRNYKDRKEIILEDKDHIIVYDMHEPIISKEQFNKVQELIKDKCVKTSRSEKVLYPLSGLLRCMDCKAPMIRNATYQKGKWYVYYKCRAYNQLGLTACNHSHSIKEEKILSVLRFSLNSQIQTLTNIKRVISQINQYRSIQKLSVDYEKLIAQKVMKKENSKTMKLNSYMDWKNNIISKDDYAFMVDKFDSMIGKLTKEITALQAEKKTEEDIRNNEFSWLENIINHGYLESITREIATEFIDCIYVSKDKNIRIVFKYQNEYDRLVDYIATFSDSGGLAQGGM